MGAYMCVNILNIYLVNMIDVPASLNTEDRISIRYPIMLLSERSRHSQGMCDTLTTLTQKMLNNKDKMSQTAREHGLPVLPQTDINF
jgi:hypothetical protein